MMKRLVVDVERPCKLKNWTLQTYTPVSNTSPAEKVLGSLGLVLAAVQSKMFRTRFLPGNDLQS